MRKNTLILVSIGLVLFSTLLIICCKTSNSAPPVPVYATRCDSFLEGSYSGSDICSSGQVSYTCNIISNTPGNITFSNLYGAMVTATVDCANNKITIPTQTFSGNFSISGTGTYTANRITINWTGNSFGAPLNCTTYYTR